MDRSTNLDIEELKVRDVRGWRRSFLPGPRLLSCSPVCLFSLPLPCAAGIVGGPVGRRVGIWGEVYPGAPPRPEDEHGGRLSGVRRALSGQVPLPPRPGACSSRQQPSCPPLVSYSSTLGSRPGAACPLTSPGKRRRRAAQSLPAVAWLPSKVARAARPLCLLFPLRAACRLARHGDSLFPLRNSQYRGVCSDGSLSFRLFMRPLSPPSTDTVSATVAWPWARTRVQWGDPLQSKGLERFPRWPGGRERSERACPEHPAQSGPGGVGRGRGGGSGSGLKGVGREAVPREILCILPTVGEGAVLTCAEPTLPPPLRWVLSRHPLPPGSPAPQRGVGWQARSG